jgi:hypothetical protein
MVLHQNFPNIFLPKFDFILVLLSELFDILGMPFFQLMSWSEIVFFSSCFVQFVLHLPQDSLIMLSGNISLLILFLNNVQF